MFWFGAVLSLCYVPGLTGAYIATQWPVLAVALPLFLLFRSGPFTTVHALMAIFVAYAGVHALFTPVPYAAVFGLWLVVIMGLSLWFGSTLQDVRGLYAGLAVGGTVSSALAVAQHFGLEWPPSTSNTPAGLYVNSVQAGTVMAVLFVALLTAGRARLALLLAPGIYLSGSRGAWFALAIGLTSFGIRRTWLFGGAVAAVAAYLTFHSAPSDGVRLLIWQDLWHGLTWLGYGPGTLYTVVLTQNGVPFFPEHAHNDALQLAFEYGVGALPLFAIFGYALSRTDAREWPIVVTVATASCYSMPLWMPLASFVAFVAMGCMLRTDAMALLYGGHSRLPVVPWRRWASPLSGPDIPVASHHPAEG